SLGFLLKREDLFHGGVQSSGDPQSEIDAGRIVAALGGDDRLSGYACQLCQLCLSESGRLANLLEVRSLHFHIAPRCQDRKSTRLNSSHVSISYAVFCLKKKNERSNLKG